MQPWDFLFIERAETRSVISALFERERRAAARFYDEPRRSEYRALKLEGIAETPLNMSPVGIAAETAAGTRGRRAGS